MRHCASQAPAGKTYHLMLVVSFLKVLAEASVRYCLQGVLVARFESQKYYAVFVSNM